MFNSVTEDNSGLYFLMLVGILIVICTSTVTLTKFEGRHSLRFYSEMLALIIGKMLKERSETIIVRTFNLHT